MKYPKAFEDWWKRYSGQDIYGSWICIAYRAWRAGRRYEKSLRRGFHPTKGMQQHEN